LSAVLTCRATRAAWLGRRSLPHSNRSKCPLSPGSFREASEGSRVVLVRLLSVSFCLGCLNAPQSNEDREIIFHEGFEKGLSTVWKGVKFSGQTDYRAVREGTNSVLQAKARAPAPGLGMDKTFQLSPGLKLQWRWKIDRIPARGSETDIG